MFSSSLQIFGQITKLLSKYFIISVIFLLIQIGDNPSLCNFIQNNDKLYFHLCESVGIEAIEVGGGKVGPCWLSDLYQRLLKQFVIIGLFLLDSRVLTVEGALIRKWHFKKIFGYYCPERQVCQQGSLHNLRTTSRYLYITAIFPTLV